MQKQHFSEPEGESFIFPELSRSSQYLVYLSSRELQQFVSAENLVHNSGFIFLLLPRFTYIHVPFRESFIVITGEKPKRDLYKYPSKTFRV